MEHTPIIEATHFVESDRVTVCAECGNDLESWKLKDIYSSWGHKKDTKSGSAYFLVKSCPAAN